MKRLLLLSAIALLSWQPAAALYDPEPDSVLASIQGEWVGSLTYRDYAQPDRTVTLPTKLFVAMASPSEITLHYVFADGGSKTVYSYENMSVNLSKKELTWVSGIAEKSTAVFVITLVVEQGASRKLIFERRRGTEIDRFTLELGPTSIFLGKEEVSENGEASFRNKFVFKRAGV